MRTLRSLVASSALLALVATATAAPAAAAPGKGTIGIVNGALGGRVDVCINGWEVRSNTRYGGRTYRVLDPGTKVIKVFRADPRRCKGKRLGMKTIALAAGDDLTIVFTRKAPKFTVFANTIGEIPAAPGDPFPVPVVYMRYAGDFGDVSIKYRLALPENPAPAIDPVWSKGDQFFGTWPVGYGMKVRATRPDKGWTIARSKWIDLEAGKRHEFILLGAKPKNAKFIVWIRQIVEPTP